MFKGGRKQGQIREFFENKVSNEKFFVECKNFSHIQSNMMVRMKAHFLKCIKETIDEYLLPPSLTNETEKYVDN